MEPYVSDDCVVAIDAPLISRNPNGSRPCETALNRDFHRFEAELIRLTPRTPVQKSPWRPDSDHTHARHGSRVKFVAAGIEVYPHPATIALFGLEKTLKYKTGFLETRRHELLQLMTLIEGLDKATPRLRVNHNVSWVELQKRVAADSTSATR